MQRTLYSAGRGFESHWRYRFAPVLMVQRQGHLPSTQMVRVRLPLGTPRSCIPTGRGRRLRRRPRPRASGAKEGVSTSAASGAGSGRSRPGAFPVRIRAGVRRGLAAGRPTGCGALAARLPWVQEQGVRLPAFQPGRVAQSVGHHLVRVGGAGSTPVTFARALIAQVDRATVYEAVRSRFESWWVRWSRRSESGLRLRSLLFPPVQ